MSGGTKPRRLETAALAYFYFKQGAAFLVIREGQRLTIDYSLGQLVPLPDPRQFFCVNRQYVSSPGRGAAGGAVSWGMKYLLIIAVLAAPPALAQTPSAKSTKRAQPPVAARNTTLGHQFITKSKQWDGPVTARMLRKKK